MEDGLPCLVTFALRVRGGVGLNPSSEVSALVAGLALTKKKPPQGKREDAAHKEDDPFPPLRHDALMMEVLYA